ncbi:beta-N-acetylhexosaminidase [Hyphococcus lacteus]|uniref:beta-N-acetylhexosaminidase n=1 Tax=Hyphococcus lacteus TaxID=3143536 RepID=A0ABV3Z7Z8_9PROT
MPTAAIFDCEGARLSSEERAFFRDVDPWGFIVFARHCESPEQLRAHCDELRECVGRDNAPILIDQEGGRVARMKPPVFPEHPAPAMFGELYRLDPKKATEAARLNGYLLGRLVSDCGVNVNCVPMLDVPQMDADPVVIGDRALAKHQDTIIKLAQAQIDGLKDGGALPVIKHLPGHGRALCDSHHDLPNVCARKADLEEVDFHPFKALCETRMGMTAHIVFEAYDTEHPATLSPAVVENVIRGDIGFDGLLMTDDLKMKALGGAISDRISSAYEAGCDIVLNCNFSMGEKQESAKALKTLKGKAEQRAKAALLELRVVDRDDTAEAYERLGALLKPVLA